MLRVFAELFQTAIDQRIEASRGKAVVLPPLSRRKSGEKKQGFLDAGNRIDGKFFLFHGPEDVGSQHQMIDVVGGNKDALRPCESVAGADLEKAFNFTGDTADGHDLPRMADGARKGKIKPDRHFRQR